MVFNIFRYIVVPILAPISAAIIVVFGGRFFLKEYEERQKQKEQEVALLRSVREQQYKAVELLYDLFSQFMALYREMSNFVAPASATNLSKDELNELLKRAIKAETQLDALIVRIVCEFVNKPNEDHAYLLGHLRQSAQSWRETIREGKMVHFGSTKDPEYVRFKTTFTQTAAFMVHHIHEHLERPPTMDNKQAANLLIKIFYAREYKLDSYKPNPDPT